MSGVLRSETYRARTLRRSSTPAEKVLWAALRDRRLDGIKFRRHQPLGPFIVDFFSEQARLVVELDGANHFPRNDRDRMRDEFFRGAGIAVLRFPNRTVIDDLEYVLERIRASLRSEAPLLGERGWG